MEPSILDSLNLPGIFSDYVITQILDRVRKAVGRKKVNESLESDSNASILLQTHFNEVLNWSSNIQFYGLNKAHKTDEVTLELSISSKVRRVDGNRKTEASSELTEDELLSSNENFLILGDPGAGKTTTLKRLARKILKQDSFKKYDKFPLLVRLKDLTVGDSLYRSICHIVGIQYEVRKMERYINFIDDGNNHRTQTLYYNQYFIDDIPLDIAIPNFFEHVRVTLILDGIDEINNDIKDDILKEIQSLSAKKTKNSQILTTCRSVDYYKTLIGFSVCEISPLSDSQIKEIAAYWTSDTKLFFETLDNASYKDLADRPLFLGNLLLLFNKERDLPDRPKEVYQKIIYLVMKDWDYDRTIVRKSKYSQFDTQRKIEFLEQLSYYLTYKIKTTVFGYEALSQVYRQIHSNFKLPISEMDLVIQEIESHSGIIIKFYGNKYEFCHLSLQEFLCASFLAKLQLNHKVVSEYLFEYPAPLAIAASIAGDPGNFVANVVLKAFTTLPLTQGDVSKGTMHFKIFISRIILERPYFTSDSKELGYAILFLCFYFYTPLSVYIDQLLRQQAVRICLSEALGQYKPTSQKTIEWIFVKLNSNLKIVDLGIKMPVDGKIPKSMIKSLYIEFPSQLYHYSEYR